MQKLRREQMESSKKVGHGRRAPCTVTTDSKVRIARGVSCKCTPGETVAFFKRGTQTMKLPIARTASYLLSQLSDGQSHLVETLTCEDPVERLCVCQVLIGKECVEIDDGQA